MSSKRNMVNVHSAKTHFSKLLDRAHAGEEVTIAKAGKPYAKLVPLGHAAKRTLGFVAGSVAEDVFAPLGEDELQLWYAGNLVPKSRRRSR